jgi:hypothetical protein
MSTGIFDIEKAAFKSDLQDVSTSLQDDSSFGEHKEGVGLAVFLEISPEPPKEQHNEKEKPEEEWESRVG